MTGLGFFITSNVISSIPGFVVLHACRNYHGADAICALIARFPDLLFEGSLHTDVNYDRYELFHGWSGEMVFREFVIGDIEERLAGALSKSD